MQQMIFIAYSTCFGHHYVHHQELESIIQVVAACGIWCFGFQVVGMVWSWGVMCPVCFKQQPANRTHNPQLHTIPKTWKPTPNTTGKNHLNNTLELLMMGVVVPEKCWASNKICNKNHLLQLVSILFQHINLLLVECCLCHGNSKFNFKCISD